MTADRRTEKDRRLDEARIRYEDTVLTTDQGVRVDDTDNALKAGERGPTLFDLVGNNMPVFFIQDGVKFPGFVHAVKPEPHNEIPQASSAHDTLWDFVRPQPETTHMTMWLMSDRALPRSHRMTQGFGVHTFPLVDAEGRGTFVKFHGRPKPGVHSPVWDETQKITGGDPDFNRRDLWEAIAAHRHPDRPTERVPA